MWEQLRPRVEALVREGAHVLNEVAVLLGRVLLAFWELVRPGLVLALNILAALILLFEEWGWQPLSSLLARLARFPLWAKLELFIAGLPPYGALVALAIPSAVLIPAKLVGVYFLTTGHLISAGVVIFLAKIASTALITRVLILTKPALMQIGWFARGYEVFVPWKDALFACIRASWAWRYGRVVKWRARNYTREAWEKLKPRLLNVWRDVEPVVERVRVRLRTLWLGIAQHISTLRNGVPRQLPPPDGR
jgi:hypothetical protein